MKRLLPLLLILAAPALGQQRNPLTRGLADTLYVKLAGSDTVLGTVTFTNLVVTGTCTGCGSGSGTGDFVGPGAATDNAVVRFDGTTGKLGQNSVVTIGDAGEVAGAKYVDLNGGSGLFRISTSATGFSIFDFADSGQSVSLSLAGLTSSHTITVPDADGTLAFTTSTVAKATALTANGTNCSASNAPLGVDASGNSEGCFAVLVPSGALGTPSSGTLTNATGLPISTGVSGLASGIATFLGAATSANLAAAVSDETGSGLLVFGTSPVIVTPTIASFVNATHNHQNAAGGGSLDAAAIGSGTFVAGRMPALTNDVTTSAGSVATSVVQLHLNVTALTSASSPYTVAATDSYIGADATSGTITINLPAATGSRRLIIVKKVDAVNNVTITPNGTDTIDGSNASMVANMQNANHGFIDAAAGVWYTSHRIAIGGALSGSSNNVTVNVLNTTATTAGTARSDTATAPAQTASAQAGVGYSITASPAVAGSTNAGAATGGPVTITSGAAARLSSGNANGNDITLTTGAGVGTGTAGKVNISTAGSWLVLPNGTAAQPSRLFAGSFQNDGWYYDATNHVEIKAVNSVNQLAITGTPTVRLNSAGVLGWAATTDADASSDTGISRGAVAGLTDFGTGAQGSIAGWVVDAGHCFVTSDQTNSTATAASTTCSMSLITGRKYSFTCEMFLSDSVAADGAVIDFNGGSATSTNFRAQVTAFDTALNLSAVLTSLSGAATATTFTGAGAFEIHGSFEPSSTGTFIPRFAQAAHSAGTLTLARGSYCKINDMQ